jgi:hypothetical protein
MNLSSADRTKYPGFCQYVRYAMPKVIDVPLIVKNMKKYGSLTPAKLKTALSWGSHPTIIIKDLNIHTCGAAGTGAWGCFRPASPTLLEVRKDLVEDFEKNMSKGKDNKNAKGKIVYVVGATILHELCHWGNNQAGVAEAEEMGLAFEKATYGKTIW